MYRSWFKYVWIHAVLFGYTKELTTKLWDKKYPVLVSYQQQVDIPAYETVLKEQLSQLKQDYGYSDMDALLVLKDILGHIF